MSPFRRSIFDVEAFWQREVTLPKKPEAVKPEKKIEVKAVT